MTIGEFGVDAANRAILKRGNTYGSSKKNGIS